MAEARIELPCELGRVIAERVAAGEFSDATELVTEAVRYYLDRHREEDWREYVAKEVAWSARHSDG